MTAYLPVGFLIFGLISISVFDLIMNQSVEGYEDESGFHAGLESPQSGWATVIEFNGAARDRSFEKTSSGWSLSTESNVEYHVFRP